ncbi:MAG: hypothetical protein KatS3mg071_1127 [Meiothermus sp.]|nr:MAG: hypothetical protein KatS3mg071_1127 [Meiothermus sp.]
MKRPLNVKTLEQSALTALALFVQKQGTQLDWLIDQHFVVAHLVPTLHYRWQAHLPIKATELVELWAEHLGLSEAVLRAWMPQLEPVFAEYLKLLAVDLQAHTQNPRLLQRMLGYAA